MNNFTKIKEALKYIDDHLEEPISFETIAEKFHFSSYYFHRMFSIIVGKTISAHIRERRLLNACLQLSGTDKSILNIGFDCGYNSAQSFSRAFKENYGLSPSEYRKQKYEPLVITVDEMIMMFTNRLKGGIYLKPNIIKKDILFIAGVTGDGNNTWEIWNSFEKLSKKKPLKNKISNNGYEIRLYDGEKCIVYVGYAVLSEQIDSSYTLFKLPASKYASFEVYVQKGYDSENNAMNEWITTNKEDYSEKLLDNKHYCVEYYDERFNGSETGSIVEIWIPIEKKRFV